MLTSDRKQHIRQHLVGNLLNATPDTIKKRAEDIVNILNTSGFPPDKKIAMSSFIDHQIKHFDNNNFAKEIQEFEKECKDTIIIFNQEYIDFMKEIHNTNPDSYSIRTKNRVFADKWKKYKFT